MKTTLIAFLLLAGLARAAPPVVENGDGMYTLRFDTPQGEVTVYLPDDLAAGDAILASVEGGPPPTSAPAVEAPPDFPGYVLDIGKQPRTFEQREIAWTLPASLPGNVLIVQLRDARGDEVGQVKLPVAAPAPSPPSACSLPGSGVVNQPLVITAPLAGHLHELSLRVGGRPAQVLAASPRKCIVRDPRVEGNTRIELQAGALASSGPLVNAPSTPRLRRLNPDQGKAGLTILLDGTDFGTDPNVVQVRFGGTDGKLVAVNPQHLAVEVPAQNLAACPVQVVVKGRASNPQTFTYWTTVALRLDKNPLQPGEKTSGVFLVHNTDRPVTIHFVNASPGIVSIQGGDEQTVQTSGGPDNRYQFVVVGRRSHLYQVEFDWSGQKESPGLKTGP